MLRFFAFLVLGQLAKVLDLEVVLVLAVADLHLLLLVLDTLHLRLGVLNRIIQNCGVLLVLRLALVQLV